MQEIQQNLEDVLRRMEVELEARAAEADERQRQEGKLLAEAAEARKDLFERAGVWKCTGTVQAGQSGGCYIPARARISQGRQSRAE